MTEKFTTMRHPYPAPVNMAHHGHLSGVFAPQCEEVDVSGLQVVGAIPEDLDGTYIRNGPNPRFDPIGTYVYPLDGDAMVHRIELREGSARYTNAFVRTPMVIAEEKAGRALWGGVFDRYTPDISDVGPDLTGTTRDLPNINIVSHGGRLLAMAEAAQPYALDRSDLITLGPESCSGAMLTGSTAHPKVDPDTGELVLFNYTHEAPFLTWSVVAPDGTLSRPPTPVDGVSTPLMIHDMALTPRFVVLVLCPLEFDMSKLLSGGSPLRWQPEQGTRIALVPRDGSAVRWIETDAFWVWHIANAFEDTSGSVTIDYAHWSYPAGIVTYREEPVRALARITLDPVRRTYTEQFISERHYEFPRIDDRRIMLRHKTIAVVDVASRSSAGQSGLNTLRFVDPDTGTDTALDSGTISVGEPIFLPGTDNGYWGTIGTDLADMTSWFLICSVDDPAAGTLAAIHLPMRVPAGLHGTWIPA